MRIDRIKLITAMVRQDMSASELAQKAGLSRSTISAIKGGKSCSRATAAKIEAVLGSGLVMDMSEAITVDK